MTTEFLRNKPGRLLRELTFKKVGKEEYVMHKPGKAVTVERKNFEPGKFVIFAGKAIYAVVPGEELHEYVEWK
jgi:hypothetical protein